MLQGELRAKQCSFYGLSKYKPNPYAFIVVWMSEAKGFPSLCCFKNYQEDPEYMCFVPLGLS